MRDCVYKTQKEQKDFPGSPVAKTSHCQMQEGAAWVLGQGTGSHVCMQSHFTLCEAMDSSRLLSIAQDSGRRPQNGFLALSRGSCQLRGQTCVPCIGSRSFLLYCSFPRKLSACYQANHIVINKQIMNRERGKERYPSQDKLELLALPCLFH